MKKNTQKHSKFKSKNVKHSFGGTRVTSYSGLSPLMKFINKAGIGTQLNKLFPTIMHNATKFSNSQVMLSVVLASLAGVHRLKRISHFTRDALVLNLLGLSHGLNKDVIGTRLKSLGQAGALGLQEYLFGWSKHWLSYNKSGEHTIDVDSTVQTVYGNQQGAAKGFNPHKPGSKSYHGLLAFASELKLVVNSWFRTGSAYTSNGVCEFVKQIKGILPADGKKIFFRADSGFFNGALFDLLDGFGWSYLVKVKLKGLKALLEQQDWEEIKGNPGLSICGFNHQCAGWGKSRKLRAIRSIKRWVEVEYFGKKELVPEYEYACYCSNLQGDGAYLHQRYTERSVSETWIEQVKSQLLAGKNLTGDFHANDILWQLQVFAYNLSLMARYKIKKFWRQEHKTFRDWFINVPAKVVHGGNYVWMKIYENYYFKNKWLELERVIT